MVAIEDRDGRSCRDRSTSGGGRHQARDAGQFDGLGSKLSKFGVYLDGVGEILPLFRGKRAVVGEALQRSFRHDATVTTHEISPFE